MSISSLFLRSGVVSLASLSLLANPVSGLTGYTYTLNTVYQGATFFDAFDFFTDADPTHGFVTYTDKTTAASSNLIEASATGPAYLRVDTTGVYNSTQFPGGRPSVRISSQAAYTHGLFIADVAHMPGGICGTWPALWTLGPDWPNNGEIDIIEGVNSQTVNLMSLHASTNCTIAGSSSAQLGTLQSNDCNYTPENVGCGSTANTAQSYGTGFNGIGGGVYAMQWTSDFIRTYFFPRGSIPADITAGSPDPSGWGLPQADFEGSCDIDTHFAKHNIVVDTTFCGDYAGNTWTSDATCSSLAPTCNEYVANNPGAFVNAYWAFNSVKVYDLVAAVVSSTSSALLSSATPVSSVLGPGMGSNSTSTSSTATTTAILTPGVTPITTPVATASAIATSGSSSGGSSGASTPSVIGNFVNVGCVGSTTGFPGFVLTLSSASMTNELCVAQCGSFQYAATHNNQCFCSDSVDAGTGVAEANGQCTVLCPGNSAEYCGGDALAAKLHRRQVDTGTLLTLYQSVDSLIGDAIDDVLGAVHFIATGIAAIPANLPSAVPVSQLLGFGMGGSPYGANAVNAANISALATGASAASQFDETVVSATYVDVGPTGLVTVTTSMTITDYACTGLASAAAIPMTVTEKVCPVCEAGQQTVTVTVPNEVAIQSASVAASAAASAAANGVSAAVVTYSAAPVTVVASVTSTWQATNTPVSPTSTSSVYTAASATGSVQYFEGAANGLNLGESIVVSVIVGVIGMAVVLV